MKPTVAPLTSSGSSAQVTALTSLPNASLNSLFRQWYGEGETLANTGAYGRALRCFEEAAIVCPQEISVLVYQAVCLIHLGQPEGALGLVEQVLALAPNHAQGWLFKGVALQRLGRYREAYACYAQVKPS